MRERRCTRIFDARFDAGGPMRTTVTLDDELLATAKEWSDIDDTGVVIRKALRNYVAWLAQQRLAKLGGTMPELQDVPRRRFDSLIVEDPE